MIELLPLIGVFLLGILLNALFAGYETGFLMVDQIRMKHLAEDEGNPRARILHRARQRPDRMLTTVLIGTNLSLIVGTYALSGVIETAWVASLVATPAYLLFAEVIPKSVFLRHPNRLSLRLLPVIRFFDLLLSPLILPTMWALRGFRAILGLEEHFAMPLMSTEDDLRNLIDESASRGSIERDEQQMIHSIMDLEETQAKAIMVPRIQITAIAATATRAELLAMFEETGLTRVPVYEESVDKIIGIVIAYDVLTDENSDETTISRFVREVMHVPDTKPVDQLLQEMKLTKHHVAIVTDEYGGTDGLITIEDILEEIFGEIHDEHDPREYPIVQVGPRAFVVDAGVTLEDLGDAMHVNLVDDEVETVGGWVMRAAGRIPAQGEKITHDGFRVTVLEGARSRIQKVRLEILPEREVEADDSK